MSERQTPPPHGTSAVWIAWPPNLRAPPSVGRTFGTGAAGINRVKATNSGARARLDGAKLKHAGVGKRRDQSGSVTASGATDLESTCSVSTQPSNGTESVAPGPMADFPNNEMRAEANDVMGRSRSRLASVRPRKETERASEQRPAANRSKL